MQSFNVEQAAQYIRLRGPRKTGFAELAVSKHVSQETSVSSRKASRDSDIGSQNVSVVSYRKVSSPDEIPTEYSEDYQSSEPSK